MHLGVFANLKGFKVVRKKCAFYARPWGLRAAHLPCLVMIISVWCRWNFSQRGRLHR